MKILLTSLTILFLISCKDSSTIIQQESTQPTAVYPTDITKVFDQHGGLELWQSMKVLSYEIVKEPTNEKQTIDLTTRIEKIEGSNFISGWNGKEYWVEADTSYKGNPKFYTNLNFYFYAMPFVLADDGINYEKVAALEFDGIKYPGFKITYSDGVGISSKDEYFIHFNPDTYEMAWLGYTVTFFSGEKSERTSWIRYNDWGSFEGLKLPKSLTWYKTDDGKITEPKKSKNFENIKLSSTALPLSAFQKTIAAKIVE